MRYHATMHVADALLAAADATAPVCVGLDPVLARLPAALRPDDDADDATVAAAFETFGRELVGAIAGTVPCLKPQSACFERYGAAGIRARDAIIDAAHDAGVIVILDAKRGDIGISAAHYAAMADATGAAWITVNPYLGAETLAPYLSATRGAFALVRTSNPGSSDLQSLRLEDGRCVADAVADAVATLGRTQLGAHGYGALGAVVGATHPDDAARLRERMPQTLFLVPGYGAQGGGVDDVLPAFNDDGRGAIITASRSVIYAFDDAAGATWTDAVATAARQLADDIGSAAARRAGTTSTI